MNFSSNQIGLTQATVYDISAADLAGANSGQRPDLLAKTQAIYRTPDQKLYAANAARSQLVAAALPVTAQTNPLSPGIGSMSSPSFDSILLPKASEFIGFRSSLPVQHHNRAQFRGLAGAPSVALPFTPTTFVFIDPSAAVNGSGSYASPYNTIPSDYSLTPGTVVLLRAGTRATGRTLFNCNNVYFGAYGSGPKPIWDANGAASCISGSDNNAGVVIRDISFVGNRQRLISNGSGTPVSTNIAWTVMGCSFTLTPSGLGIDCNAVQLWGAGVKVLANVFDGVTTDAIWVLGDNCECAYNIIRNVALDGREAGDCIQIADGSNAHIHHNDLDHSSSDGKQCVIVGSSGTGAGAVVEYNICRHVSNMALNSNAIYTGATSTIRKNIVIGARNGVWASGSSVIESNVIVNNDTNGMGIALPAGAGLTLTVLNNTVLSSDGVGKYGLRYNGGTSPTSLTLRNNIFQGFRSRGVELLGITNVTEGSNCYFNNVSNSDRVLNSTSFIADPYLDGSYVPQNPMLTQFGVAGATEDLFGTLFSGRCIGAVQPDTTNFDRTNLTVFSALAFS